MSFQTTTPNYQPKAPKEVLYEQMSLAFAAYSKAERIERVKAGLARKKAANRDCK